MGVLVHPAVFSSCEALLDLLLNLEIVGGGEVVAWEHGRKLWCGPR